MRFAPWSAAALAGLLVSMAGTATADLLGAGKAMPAWSGKTTAGKTISSKQYQKKVVLLNFFSYN